jgi:tetraacyldisaccharide 4'-kinase
MTHFFETLFYRPRWYHWVASILLLPLSLTYGIGMWIRRKISRRKQYPVSIISVGNLVIGGSGKTPFVIALAAHFSDRRVAIISRGYGRQSSGLVEVSREGEVLVAVGQSGDEAMLMAIRSPHASVIVSEKREPAIERAIEQGAELILLDDGFNRVEIEKYEILLEPEKLPNRLPLPSGPMREFAWCNRVADMILGEHRDFTRRVRYQNTTEGMLLVTAIANPSRLDRYLPEGVVDKVYLEDHAYFEEEKLKRLLAECSAQSLLVTEKDWVKMKGFDLPLSLMILELELNEGIISQIEATIRKNSESQT